MKKKKLKLAELKVQSFVTSLDAENAKTLQGGIRDIIVGPGPDVSLNNTQCEGASVCFECTSPHLCATRAQFDVNPICTGTPACGLVHLEDI